MFPVSIYIPLVLTSKQDYHWIYYKLIHYVQLWLNCFAILMYMYTSIMSSWTGERRMNMLKFNVTLNMVPSMFIISFFWFYVWTFCVLYFTSYILIKFTSITLGILMITKIWDIGTLDLGRQHLLVYLCVIFLTCRACYKVNLIISSTITS